MKDNKYKETYEKNIAIVKSNINQCNDNLNEVKENTKKSLIIAKKKKICKKILMI